MKAEELFQMVHDTLSYSLDDDGCLRFHRFTASQRQVYGQESLDWEMKCGASASVTLDFLTDSAYVALKFDLAPGSFRRWASIDFYVDGVFYASRYIEDLNISLAGTLLPEGEHRVTVYLPWSTQTVVHEVLLSDGAKVAPVEKKRRMLCFGDSITQGYLSKFTSLSYVNQAARALAAEVVNQGIGGYYFRAETIDNTIRDYRPDVITVAYGTNDYSRHETCEEYTACAQEYIQKLAALFPDTPILGILPLYRNDQNYQVRKLYGTYSLDDARAALERCYMACPNGYVLEETGIPHIPQVYAPDYLHPNEFGFTLMARGVIQKLQEILQK